MSRRLPYTSSAGMIAVTIAVTIAGLVAGPAMAPAVAAEQPLLTTPVPEPCQVQVQHPVGDLAVHRVRGTSVEAHGDSTVWRVDANTQDGVLQLRSAGAEASQGHADAVPLRIDVPRGCHLVVRGDAGRVDLHGRHEAPLDVETVTGAITLWAERRADLRVELLSSELLGTDYSIEIEHMRHQEPDKRGVVVLGNGGVQARLASRRGVVSVLDRERAVGH